MTCDELKEQEATLRAQSDTLLSTIAANQNAENIQFAAALASDTYGGTYPQNNQTSIMARIGYLMQIQPQTQAITSLINSYWACYNALQTIYTEQQALQMTNSALASVLQQEINQGC